MMTRIELMQGMLPVDWLKVHFEPLGGQCSKVSASSELNSLCSATMTTTIVLAAYFSLRNTSATR